MTYAVIYNSATGNTKMLADRIRKKLGEDDCVFFGGPRTDVPKADILFVGFWTDKGYCSEELQILLKQMENENVFLFGTAGFGKSRDYFDKILGRVEAMLSAGNKVAGSFMCQGKMQESVRRRYETMLEQDPKDMRAQQLIENFDQALTHPDEKDLENLDQCLKELL